MLSLFATLHFPRFFVLSFSYLSEDFDRQDHHPWSGEQRHHQHCQGKDLGSLSWFDLGQNCELGILIWEKITSYRFWFGGKIILGVWFGWLPRRWGFWFAVVQGHGSRVGFVVDSDSKSSFAPPWECVPIWLMVHFKYLY